MTRLSSEFGQPRVHFRPITQDNLGDCLKLELDEAQRGLIAPNVYSIAEAYVNPTLQPFGVYEQGSLGFKTPVTPMVGFIVLEITAGTGFILRLMIDRRFQRQGLGRATVREAVRRLRLDPAVQLIATSHRHENRAVGQLFGAAGFVPWNIEYARDHPTESFLYLPDTLA